MGEQQGEAMDISTIKALTFDTFGTLVDWRSTMTWRTSCASRLLPMCEQQWETV